MTVAQFFGLGLKPKLSLVVRSARVGFKPILKKARGFVTAGCELTSIVSEFGLGPGLVLDPGRCPDAVSDSGLDPGTNSLLIHFSITSVTSSAAVQEKIIANWTVIIPPSTRSC
jgi:hypothetical protein